MSQTVLITGTSTGVGFSTALLLARQGFQVFATMRNLEKADALQQATEAEQLNLTILQLDVCDNTSVQRAVDEVIQQTNKIDILINNAGAGFAKTTEQASLEEIDWVTDTNYTGTVRVTKAVLPHMRKAKLGHIINITSVGGLVGQPFNEFYCAAKFAVEGYTESLASYISPFFNIKFSLIEPGGIATEFANSVIAKTINEKGEFASGDYAPIMQKYLSGVQSRASAGEELVYQTADEVAQVILDVIEAQDPPLRIRTSDWAETFTKLKTQADPDGTKSVMDVVERFLSDHNK